MLPAEKQVVKCGRRQPLPVQIGASAALATIGDVAAPAWRASSVGVYRLWRDLGYAVGAVVAGLTADSLGLKGAMWFVAGITLLSGVIVSVRMDETLQRRMA